MSNDHGRDTFESMYAGTPPWDIGRPQREIVDAADRVTGSILDAGCGTGEHSLYFAGLGRRVLGIDFLEGPIRAARRKAGERGLDAEFAVMDALTLTTLDQRFDNVIDSGLFHVFSDEDRARYVAGLTHVTNPGGRLFLLCFSDKEPGTQGPRRVAEHELRDAFKTAWAIEELRPTRFEIVPDLADLSFSEGGPRAWFCVARRNSAPVS